MTYLINLSLQQCIFQEALKTARVTPICKKDPQLSSNYRPSLFCQFLANCIKYVCILAFTRFWQNINCFLRRNLVLETTTLQAMHWSVYWSDQEISWLFVLQDPCIGHFPKTESNMSLYLDTSWVSKQLLLVFHKVQHHVLSIFFFI